MDHDPRQSLDDGEALVERGLDALGEHERASAPEGLEARVLAGSLAGLRAGACEVGTGMVAQDGGVDAPLLRHAAGRAARRAGQSRRRIAIAAGLGAVACVTAAWLALRGATGGGPIAPPDRAIAHDGGSPGSISGATGAAPENADVELEAMFLASSLLSGGMDEELASISAQAASVGLGLTDPVGSEWSESLMSGESL